MDEIGPMGLDTQRHLALDTYGTTFQGIIDTLKAIGGVMGAYHRTRMRLFQSYFSHSRMTEKKKRCYLQELSEIIQSLGINIFYLFDIARRWNTVIHTYNNDHTFPHSPLRGFPTLWNSPGNFDEFIRGYIGELTKAIEIIYKAQHTLPRGTQSLTLIQDTRQHALVGLLPIAHKENPLG